MITDQPLQQQKILSLTTIIKKKNLSLFPAKMCSNPRCELNNLCLHFN